MTTKFCLNCHQVLIKQLARVYNQNKELFKDKKYLELQCMKCGHVNVLLCKSKNIKDIPINKLKKYLDYEEENGQHNFLEYKRSA